MTNPALATPRLGVMNFLNQVAETYPSAISFAPGRPLERFFHVDAAIQGISRWVEFAAGQTSIPEADVLSGLGQYGRTNGIIHDLVCRHLAVDQGIEVDASSLVITSGAQEAMSILLQGVFDRDRDVLLVTDPSYIGITGAAAVLGISVEPVPSGEDGLDLEALIGCLARVRRAGRRPRALYDVPDFQNPLGSSMPLAARHRLLEIALAEDLLIIEDGAYGLFAYDGDRLPTLKSLDRNRSVIYIGSFSKTLLPGLRLGYLVADQPAGGSTGQTILLADELSKVKSLSTVNSSPLVQAMVGGILLANNFSLVELNRDKVAFYKSNRDWMLACLEHTFGRDEVLAGRVRWNHPRGGFFLTVTLPFAFDENCLQDCVSEHDVICCPMSFFALTGDRARQVRLAFSYVTKDQIEEGIRRFWRFVRSRVESGRVAPAPVAAEGPATSVPPVASLGRYERLARERVPADVWDYVVGGSGDEITLRENCAAFDRIHLRPRVLVGVETPEIATTVLGTRIAAPILVAPLGCQRLVHPEGELATARAVAGAGGLMVVSMMSSYTLEDVITASGPAWFQLYALRDREETATLVRRASLAGYRALVLTVDTPRLGRRQRDIRNHFALPPNVVAANLRGDSAATLEMGVPGRSAIETHARLTFDAGQTWEIVSWLRSVTNLPIVLKGIMTAEDANRAADHGVAGLIVSNHGGRQLDGVPATIDVLDEIVRAVPGQCEVYLDGGIRRGTDILKALALGARAVLVGRPILWGLASEGEAGVRRVLDYLREDLDLAMTLVGRPTLDRLDRSTVMSASTAPRVCPGL